MTLRHISPPHLIPATAAQEVPDPVGAPPAEMLQGPSGSAPCPGVVGLQRRLPARAGPVRRSTPHRGLGLSMPRTPSARRNSTRIDTVPGAAAARSGIVDGGGRLLSSHTAHGLRERQAVDTLNVASSLGGRYSSRSSRSVASLKVRRSSPGPRHWAQHLEYLEQRWRHGCFTRSGGGGTRP